LLYLKEQDEVESAELIRVFHPKISPRGVILIATKKSSNLNFINKDGS